MILVVDNYDSFTYNLVQYLGELGAELRVVRNDAVTVDEVATMTPDAIDVIAACFPAGTLSGAPKIRAMEIIDEIEPVRRGPYGGAIGYVSYSGNLDSCITIRTIVCHDGVASIQVGGGIVADSDPKTEWLETCSKARGLVLALRMAAETRA